MHEIRFRLAIGAQRFVAYYEGTVRDVVAHALDGRIVRFPAEHLRPFVTHAGVFGLFALRYDDRNKLIDLRRLGD
jgi:hypothetical protein